MLNKIVAVLLVLCLTFTTLAQAAQQAQPLTDPADGEALRKLSAVVAFSEDVRGHVDRARFDLTALLEKLEFDPERIVHFVRSEIAFQQYEGVLRGARGTLMSRAGNSLDQSLLLATLLKDAGLEAQINRTKITSEQAAALLAQMGIRGDRKSEEQSLPIQDIIRRHSPALGLSPDQIETVFKSIESEQIEKSSYADVVQRESKNLLALLEKANVKLGDPSDDDDLLKEAQDYFWVSYRSGPNESWKSIHPAISEDDSFSDLDVKSVIQDSVPIELQHRIRFELVMERRKGKKYESVPLSEPWERPVANLVGVPLTFTIISRQVVENAKSTFFSPIDFAIPQGPTDIFLPILNDEPIGSAFDLLGNLVPAQEAASAYAGIFATLSEKSNKAISALSQLGDDKSTKPQQTGASLQSVKINYTVLSPGGKESRYQRIVFDRGTDSESLPNHDLYTSITRQFTLMLSSGSFSDAFVADRLLSRLSDECRAAEQLSKYVAARKIPVGVRMPRDWIGYLPLFRVFRNNIGDKAYRYEPALVIHHKTLPFDGVVHESVDIVQSQIRSIHIENDIARLDALGRLRRGVWETLTESALFQKNDQHLMQDTLSIFADAEARGEAILTLLPKDRDMLKRFPISQRTKRLMDADLANGNVIIVPETWKNGAESALAWWRINPSTGSALGILANGEGSTEDITLRQVVAANVLAGLGGYFGYQLACKGKKSCNVACILGGYLGGAAVGIGFIAPWFAGVSAVASLGLLLTCPD